MAKLKIMSVSLGDELHDNLKVASKKTGKSVSDLVRTLVEHLDLVVTDGEEVPVMFHVESGIHDNLKAASKKTGKSISDLVRTLVDKHLDLVVNGGEEIPVILHLPSNLKGDPEALKAWFEVRVDSIVKRLS